jgi:hypothetical protein
MIPLRTSARRLYTSDTQTAVRCVVHTPVVIPEVPPRSPPPVDLQPPQSRTGSARPVPAGGPAGPKVQNVRERLRMRVHLCARERQQQRRQEHWCCRPRSVTSAAGQQKRHQHRASPTHQPQDQRR